MIGITFALIVLGVIVLFIFPIIGIVILALAVLFAIGTFMARRRRAAADLESGTPGSP
jgi:hypothetical protein